VGGEKQPVYAPDVIAAVTASALLSDTVFPFSVTWVA
jgi:hypothetical protein